MKVSEKYNNQEYLKNVILFLKKKNPALFCEYVHMIGQHSRLKVMIIVLNFELCW